MNSNLYTDGEPAKMQDGNIADTTQAFAPEDAAARERAFARMFKENELVWLIDEQYNADTVTWRVDFLRQEQQGRWMVFRYHYDEPTSVIYFMGARPVDEEEFPALRRKGRVFHGSQDSAAV